MQLPSSEECEEFRVFDTVLQVIVACVFYYLFYPPADGEK